MTTNTYKLTLTTGDGELLEQWQIGGAEGLDLNKAMARSVLGAEIADEIEKRERN